MRLGASLWLGTANSHKLDKAAHALVSNWASGWSVELLLLQDIKATLMIRQCNYSPWST